MLKSIKQWIFYLYRFNYKLEESNLEQQGIIIGLECTC
jgi:hypothetical protein